MAEQDEAQSLSNEELVVEIQKGAEDLIPLLWNNIYRFILKQAKEYIMGFPSNKQSLFDDMVNQSYFALLEAIKGYQADKGRFTTYLNYHLRNAFTVVLMNGRSKKLQLEPLEHSISIDKPIETEGENLTLADMLIDESAEAYYTNIENDEFWKDVHNFLKDAVKSISNDGIKPLLMHMLNNGCTYGEAIKALGLDSKATYNEYGKALRDIRRYFAKERKRRQAIGIDEFISYAGTGLSSYRNHNYTSSVELAVIRLDEQGRKIYPVDMSIFV